MRNLFYIIFIIAFSLSLKSYAQQNDSIKTYGLDTTHILYHYKSSAFSQIDTIMLDSTLHNFHRYTVRMNEYDMAAGTRYIGGPIKDLYFTGFNPQFTIGEHSLGKYFYESKNMPYYSNVRTPYSEAFFTLASNEENYLKGIIAAQASDRLYYGLNFNVESTIGLMTNSKLKNSHFRGIIAFEALNKRYGYDVEYIYNKMQFGENGGLVDESYYDSSQYERQVLPVNLTDATNLTKSNYFKFNQHLNIGKAATDSTEHNFRGKIYLNTSFQKKARLYTDNSWDSLYYKNSFLDSLASYDSLASTDFSMDFGVSNFYPEKHQYFTFNFGLKYDYKMYYNGEKEFFFNYASPHADVIFDFYKFILEGGAKYQIKIANQQTFDIGANDLNVYGRLKFPLTKDFNLDAGLRMDFESPDVRTYNIYSNHYMWDNNFNKQKHIEINSHLDIKGYQLEGAIHTLSDFVYFDEDVIPQQFLESFQVITAKFKKEFLIKGVGTQLMVMYQKSSNDNVVRLPELVAKANFFFRFPIFKKALIIHPGFDITYLTAYNGYGYNPALMQFYSHDDKPLQDQLYIDFYINFKIKRARVFVKYQNLGTLFNEYNYFLVRGYPQQDAIFKIGLSWRFID